MKTNQRAGKTSIRSSRRRRSRKTRKVAGGIFIEVLGFAAMILLFVYTRGLMEPNNRTIAEPQAQAIPENDFNEPHLQSQSGAVAIPQRESVDSVRPFRVRFGARSGTRFGTRFGTRNQ